jgi:hypothetical protein
MALHVGDRIQVAISPSETTGKNKLMRRLAGVDAGRSSFERDKGDRY